MEAAAVLRDCEPRALDRAARVREPAERGRLGGTHRHGGRTGSGREDECADPHQRAARRQPQGSGRRGGGRGLAPRQREGDVARRLEAFREVAKQLMDRPQLDRDVFSRGDPEPIAEVRQAQWSATLYDLLTAYSAQRQQKALGQVRFAKRNVWSLAEAREVLERLVGTAEDWTRLDEYLIKYVVEPSVAATVFASSFVSALELVREGVAEIHQTQAFTPIYVRKREKGAGAFPTYGATNETRDTKGGH